MSLFWKSTMDKVTYVGDAVEERLDCLGDLVKLVHFDACECRSSVKMQSFRDTESGRPRIVAEVDRKEEQLLVDGWRKRFPKDAVIGEKYGTGMVPSDAPFSLLIDSMNGKHNFGRHLDGDWVSAGAICEQGVPVASAIGTSGFQKYLAIVRGSEMKAFHGSLCRLGRDKPPDDPCRWYVASELFQLLERGHDLQRQVWDAAGHHGCYGSAISTGFMVICGQLDAYLNPAVTLYEMAVLVPFAKATGLTLTRWDGSDPFPNMWNTVMKDLPRYEKGPQCFDMLLAPPQVHAALLPLVQPYANERQIKAYGKAG